MFLPAFLTSDVIFFFVAPIWPH